MFSCSLRTALDVDPSDTLSIGMHEKNVFHRNTIQCFLLSDMVQPATLKDLSLAADAKINIIKSNQKHVD